MYIVKLSQNQSFESNNVAPQNFETVHALSKLDPEDFKTYEDLKLAISGSPMTKPATVFSTRLNISATFCNDEPSFSLTGRNGSVVLSSDDTIKFQFYPPPSTFHTVSGRASHTHFVELWEPVPLRWMYSLWIFGVRVCKIQLAYSKQFKTFMAGFVKSVMCELGDAMLKSGNNDGLALMIPPELSSLIGDYAFGNQSVVDNWEQTSPYQP